MLDLHTGQHGYTETQVPLLVNDAAMYGTDKLPKFAEDLFHTTDGRWLIPTAEVPLTSLVTDEIVPETALPIRVTALSECFRSEAGAAGRDTRGMLRQHQFRKVELVSITHPERSADEHERMTSCAEAVLTALGLCLPPGAAVRRRYRVRRRQDLRPGGLAARPAGVARDQLLLQHPRLPGAAHERAHARRRRQVAGPVHTLNGSGVAVGRALIAVMETYQQADGSIRVPDVLRPYMGGVERVARS